MLATITMPPPTPHPPLPRLEPATAMEPPRLPHLEPAAAMKPWILRGRRRNAKGRNGGGGVELRRGERSGGGGVAASSCEEARGAVVAASSCEEAPLGRGTMEASFPRAAPPSISLHVSRSAAAARCASRYHRRAGGGVVFVVGMEQGRMSGVAMSEGVAGSHLLPSFYSLIYGVSKHICADLKEK